MGDEDDSSGFLEKANSGTRSFFLPEKRKTALFFPPRHNDVLAVAALKAFQDGLAHHMTAAFLRSTVACASPVPDAAGSCPARFANVGGECQARYFSGSARCGDPARVMNAAVKRMAGLHVAMHLGHFFALFVLGPLVDLWGRRAVMLTALAGDAASLSLYALAANVDWLMLLLPAVVLAGATNAFPPACGAMVADLSKASVAGRANSFATLKAVLCLGMLLAHALGFAVLRRRLTDYSAVWVVMAVGASLLVVGARWNLAETLPETHRTKGKRSRRMVKELCRVVRKDGLLRSFVLVQLFSHTAFSVAAAVNQPFLISHLGYRQATASLQGFLLAIGRMLGVWMSRPLLKKSSPQLGVVCSLLLLALGFGVCGLAGLDDSRELVMAQCCFWGGLALLVFGAGLGENAGTVFLSLRVDEAALGAVFSLEHSLGLVGGLLGDCLGASRGFFDAKATGWARSFCFLYCAGSLACALAWWAFALLLDRWREENSSSNSSQSDSGEESE